MEEKEVKQTYEELEAQVKKYEEEIKAYVALNNQLYQQLITSNMSNLYKRLDYLFKVLETKDCFNSEFIISCAEEVQKIMTPEETKEVNE